MDEAIDIIQTCGKTQQIQSVVIVFLCALNNIVVIIMPFLMKKPSFLCSPKDEYNPAYSECQEALACDAIHFSYVIDSASSLNNWARDHHFYCIGFSYENLFTYVFFIGGLLASYPLSYLGDKFGRQLLSKILAALTFTSHLLLLFSFSSYTILIACFVVGISSYSIILSTIIIAEYLTRPNAALLTSINSSIGFLFGMLTVMLYIYINSSMLIFIITVLIAAVTCFFVFRYMIESHFWLISRNRLNECFDVLKRIAELNSRMSDYIKVEVLRYSKTSDNISIITQYDSILKIYRYESQKRRLLLHSALWFCSSLSFCNALFSIHGLDYSFSVKYFILFFIVFLSMISVGLLADIYGRQVCINYSMYMSGFFTFIYAIMPELNWMKMLSFALLLIGSSAANAVLFIFTPEDFPTFIRCTVMGTMFALNRIGGMIALYLKVSGYQVDIVFAFLCFGAGRLAELLEDTFEMILDDEVPETKIDSPFKKKAMRAVRKKKKSEASDVYFLTSDDESFNKGQTYI